MALVAPCPPAVGRGGHRPSHGGLLSDVVTRSCGAAGGSASRARQKGAVATPIPRAMASNWSADGWLPPFPAFGSGPSGGRTYRRMDSCLVIPPPAGQKPLAIIKFLGGAFVGAAPEVTYSHLMELLAKEGFLVVSVPYEVTFDHSRAARQVYERFHDCMDGILASGIPGADLRGEDLVGLPLYSVGHSNGALLQVLVGSYFSEKIPKANAIISFNNRPASEAVPYFEQASLGPSHPKALRLAKAAPWGCLLGTYKVGLHLAHVWVRLGRYLGGKSYTSCFQVTQGISEFKPTPSENRDLFNKTYNVPQTLLVKFDTDAIDETDTLEEVLRPRVEFIGGTLEKVSLSGNHLTPCVQDLRWQIGDRYTPVDALAQRLKSLSLNDTKLLARTIVDWFNRIGKQ
ncbi:hypothetical protein Taro_015110 [Colocasia esculenta]|uniref:Uncharacterized protein n=1 Tax=Colocasia esculenta TaxID=4460 RepID=A0A843UGM1_COLES|nr:hypothetical protein [Colocasia esculenta]